MPKARPWVSVESAVSPTMAARTTMPAMSRMAPATDWRAVTTLGAAPHGQAPGGGQAGGRNDEQDEEEEGHRDHLGEDRGQAGVDVTGQVADAVLGDQPEGDGTDEGHGQAAQAPDHGGGEAVQRQQGQLVGGQTGLPDHRGQQHAGQGGQHEARGPSRPATCGTAWPRPWPPAAGSSTTARMATPRRTRRRKRPSPTRDHGRHDDEHDLLVLDGDAVAPEEVHREHGAVGLGEVARDGADDVGAAPEDGGHAEQDHQQAERHHQGALDGGAVDAPEEHELDHDGQQRRLDEDDDHDGQQEGPVPVLPQLPVREGGHHPDRTLGEVEDARRVVGDDQARGQDAVDGAEDDAEDGEREEDAHVNVSSCRHVPPDAPPRPAYDEAAALAGASK